MALALVTVEPLSEKAYELLQQLEELHILRVLPAAPAPKPDAASWVGVLSPEETAQWQQDLQTMRDEWERDL